MRSLNSLLWLRKLLVGGLRLLYNRVWGMDIHPSATFSLSARFDKTYPRGVHIGAETYIAFDAAILAHDMTRGLYLHTRIGRRCFIGGRSIILPGVEIGDECVIGAGSIVTRNVPSRTVVAGNPARIIARDISVGRFGRFSDAEQTKLRLAEEGAFSEPRSAQNPHRRQKELP